MILVLRLSNSAFIRAIVPSSVVHTGVKSLGWENRIAHLSPIHLWKSISPSVVLAVKLGASSPMRRAMGVSGSWYECRVRMQGANASQVRMRAENLNSIKALCVTGALEYSGRVNLF